MHIEYLYWPNCPSAEEGLERLKQALRDEGVAGEIEEIVVTSDEQVRELDFPGSPTIRIEGEDADPEGAAELRAALTCRLYIQPDGRPSPLPHPDTLRAAIRRHRRTS
ncbi:MAG: thioredoxin family protein [Armatimonadota bacterium]